MNNFKHIRTLLGLSQQAIADGLNCSQSNIAHIELGKQEVSPDLARLLIAFAATRGVVISFDDIYLPAASTETSAAE